MIQNSLTLCLVLCKYQKVAILFLDEVLDMAEMTKGAKTHDSNMCDHYG